MHLLVTWPLAALAFCLGLFRKSWIGVGRRYLLFLSPWSSGCVLAPSGCWKPPESSSFLEAFKGNTFSVYFCPFFPLLASSQFALLATSLRLICAPVIHELLLLFFPLAQQSHAVYVCVRVCVWGGCAGSERQKKTECWGGKVEKDCAVMPAAIRAVALAI